MVETRASSRLSCPTRSSCELCRSRKKRCDGGVPKCARCQHSGHECIYATLSPLGRPKRSMKDPRTLNFANAKPMVVKNYPNPMHFPTCEAPLIPWPDVNSEAWRPEDQGQVVFASDYSSEMDSQWHFSSTSGQSLFNVSNQACACLATLYLTLDELQSAEIDFPSGLSLLRNFLEKTKHIIQCQVCPRRFLKSVQNTQLLCTLFVSMAQRYRSVLDAIDAEHERSLNVGGMRTWTPAQLQGDKTGGPLISTSCPDFAFDVDPAEWRVLARRTVRAQIFGTVDETQHSYLSLLDSLEQRQVLWHASPPCPDWPESGIHGPEKTPFCVLHCRAARRHISLLGLTEDPDKVTEINFSSSG